MTPPPSFEIDVADESATAALGARLAAALPANSVVALFGALGAGKTRLVQAVAEALGVDVRSVVSPTFTLMHEYRGTLPICHVDAYRLNSSAEAWELGLEEHFASGGLTFVEWADRIPECMPAERLEVRISDRGPTQRRFDFEAFGGPYEAVVAQLREWATGR